MLFRVKSVEYLKIYSEAKITFMFNLCTQPPACKPVAIILFSCLLVYSIVVLVLIYIHLSLFLEGTDVVNFQILDPFRIAIFVS